ncbi:ELWxxDGT repeat protein [Myxococcus sp. AB036A]|uniref:ELWxxDGT repeat protein n=1 Tax=Myxococcus sp. AB036A TaxID=2562793 RepID=UPI0034CDAF68
MSVVGCDEADGGVPVLGVVPGHEARHPRARVLDGAEGTRYFARTDLEHGRELWKTDGTCAGTRLVKDIEPGLGSSASRNLTAIGGILFFRAETSGQGYEPWLSDRTRKGTRPLQEIAPGPQPSEPRAFTLSGWDVFFVANDGCTGFERWALPFRPEKRCRVALEQ